MHCHDFQHCSYKHAIDGMARVAREEGVRKLFSGVDWATGRAVSTHHYYLIILCIFRLLLLFLALVERYRPFDLMFNQKKTLEKQTQKYCRRYKKIEIRN